MAEQAKHTPGQQEAVEDAWIELEWDLMNLIGNQNLLFWKTEPGVASTKHGEYYPVDFRKFMEHVEAMQNAMRAAIAAAEGREV